MIFHLSYDFGPDRKSVNFHTLDEICIVKYNDLDDAISKSLVLESTTLFYGKTDISNAFRLVPLNRKSWKWCTMQCEDPETGETWMFLDKTLPFGSLVSCSIFQKFSNCLKHILEETTGDKFVRTTNYLDDFLYILISEMKCNNLVRKFLELCAFIDVPIAEEKTQWAKTSVTFLGVILDGKRKLILIPEDKRNRAINMLDFMINSRKAKVHQMETLAGFLNFLN